MLTDWTAWILEEEIDCCLQRELETFHWCLQIFQCVTFAWLSQWVYFCFANKFICIFFFFKILHIRDIVSLLYLTSLSVWPTSFSSTISRSIHAAANDTISLFLMANILLHVYAPPCLPMQKTWEMWVQSLGQEDPLEEGMTTHSSILAWGI